MDDFTSTPTMLAEAENSSWTPGLHTNTARPWRPHALSRLADSLWYTCLPVILILGTFGSVVTLIIMKRMTSGESSVNLYFTAIAIMDLVGIYSITLVQWLMYVLGFRVNATHTVVCKLHTWVYIGASASGCWCLVCMTVHRAMSVVWPHHVNLLCTRRTVIAVLVGVTVFFAALYSHYLIGYERIYSPLDKTYWCTVRPDNVGYKYFTQNVFVYLQLTVYSLLPFLVLVLANSVLVWKLTVSVKAAGRHLTQDNPEQLRAREKAANSVTLTVIVVSMVFIVLTLPISINYILNYFILSHHTASEYERAKAALTNAVTGLLGQANYAVNFYLYCLTGRRFREEFIKLMCCGRIRHVTSSVTENASK